MGSLADQFLVLSILINFIVLGTSRLGFAVRAVAIQGVVLGLLPALIHPFSWHIVFIVVLMLSVKGVLIPWLITQRPAS